MSEQKELDLPEASARLRVSYHAGYRLVLTGKLKGWRRDGRWFVDPDDLERLLRERTARTKSRSA